MMVRVRAEPRDLVLIQVYMPTTHHPDEEVEELYDQIETLLLAEKSTDYAVVMGDFNAVVGEGDQDDVVGKFGLGTRNKRGQMLINFARRRQMVVTNTWYQQPKRRRYTWKQPGDINRYQLDYILVRQRYRGGVLKALSFPGADIDSDHNLVGMKTQIRLKRIRRTQRVRRINVKVSQDMMKAYREAVEQKCHEVVNQPMSVNEKWSELKSYVLEAAKETLGNAKRAEPVKPWVTQEMVTKMAERRKWKSQNTTHAKSTYRRLNSELCRETQMARVKWWSDQCEDLERYEKRGRSDLLYERVKRITSKKTGRAACKVIQDSKGNLLSEPDAVKGRWRNYIEYLYDREGKPSPQEIPVEQESLVQDDDKGPELLEREILCALDEIKNGKSPGIDEIPVELLKCMGVEGKRRLVDVCKEIYSSGVWPQDFVQLVLVPIEKRPCATQCEDFRTISLISHASKILLKILTKRLENKAETYIGRSQFGFRKGCGTRDAIGVLRTLCERNIDNGSDLFVCFVDFEKAFDRVNWNKMLGILKAVGVDWRDRRLIANLYLSQQAVVRLDSGLTDACVIGRGVRQGCPLSPLLFNLYAETMLAEALSLNADGVRIGGNLVADVRFADDQAMVSNSESGLQSLMNDLCSAADRYDMKINIKKTKIMRVSRTSGKPVAILVNGVSLEQVTSYKYLGSVFTDDGRCEKEIRIRLAQAKEAFNRRKELLTQKFSLKLRKRLVRTLVWSVALYASETWTILKADAARIEAFEMWVWRRLLKVGWEDRVSNANILIRVQEERSIMITVQKRKRNWIGHVMRHDGLLRDVIEGRLPGKRPRGRRRTQWLDDVTPHGFKAMKDLANDRALWR
jgi:hypothetical protein